MKIQKLWYNSWIWNIFVDLLNYFRLYIFSFKHHYMDAASNFRTAASKFNFGRLNKNQIINFTNYIIHLAALGMRNIHLLYLFFEAYKTAKKFIKYLISYKFLLQVYIWGFSLQLQKGSCTGTGVFLRIHHVCWCSVHGFG